jgi:serine/threonine-protein kinase
MLPAVHPRDESSSVVDQLESLRNLEPGDLDLMHTAVLLEAQGLSALDATLPAPPPASASRLLADLSLPTLTIERADGPDLAMGEVLGEGGMGVVTVAQQRALDREVAVKRLRPALAGDAHAAWLLVDEARITGALEHPNIVPIHALGIDDRGSPVMVMKRLTGRVWRDIMHQGASKKLLSDNLETLMQVCNAVHFAHSRGVVHRDIKPENVVVGEHGEVYLLDWGVAVSLASASSSEAIVGTLAYMAPEMLRGMGPHITPQTDVYLLGASLYEMLTGDPPHAAASVDVALISICRSEVGTYPEWVPRELADLCRRALARDPRERPPTALAFKQAIIDYVRHSGSIDIARAASARLGDLTALCRDLTPSDHADAEATRVNQLYIECAFGYRQAIEIWAHNDEAREGLQEAVETMIGFELARRNPEAALALLDQLPQARDDLRHAIEKLRGALAEEGRELARLRSIAQEQDPSVSSSVRALSAVITGVVLALLFLWLSRVYPRTAGLTHRTIAIVTLVIGAGLAAATAVARDKMLANQINRYLTATMFGIVIAIVALHVGGHLSDAPVAFGLIADLLISGSVVAAVGFSIHRGMVVVGLVYLAGALVAAAMSRLVLEVMGVTFLLSHLALAWTWRALAHEAKSRDATKPPEA